MKKTLVWAHRGASAYAPENTLEAFTLAVEQKADGIELDVQRTRDGRLVVIHDETVDRVSRATGWVKDFTYEKLKKINVNQRFLQQGTQYVPTLEEVYEPFLIKEGFLKRTPRGRETTDLAYTHLGRKRFDAPGSLFE